MRCRLVVRPLLCVLCLLAADCRRAATESPAPASPASGPAQATSPPPTTPSQTTPPPAAKGAEPAAEASSDEPPSDELIARVLTPWNGDLDEMVQRRFIRVLVTFSKTNYFVDQAVQRGITYDAGKLFENFLNTRLKAKTIQTQLMFIPVARDQLFTSLAEGRGDIAAAGLTITPERARIVDFATPALTNVSEVVVTGPDSPAINQPADLSGREVHVRKSSSYYESLTALNKTLKASGSKPVTIVAANEALEPEDLLEMVNAGVIPATVVDSHFATLWAKVFPNIRVQPAAVRTGGQVAWAVRRSAPKLRAAVNDFVAANPKGSLNYNLLFSKYFGNTKWIMNPNAAADRKRFEEMVQFFKKYGDQYNIPYMLIAAQAYQESQIDQQRKSSAGAVGVMQIKPSTAAGKPISITGVDKSAERNIQAGVKYLRFMIDQYYAKEPMDRLTKGVFAVASYNAGPARVAGLRQKAKRMGLDPNKWFGNVEVVAAREIGRETVQYVSNIFKYYIAYDLLSRQEAARRAGRQRSAP
jgi:membrane-bound lytic murein transglycosylase MltF